MKPGPDLRNRRRSWSLGVGEGRHHFTVYEMASSEDGAFWTSFLRTLVARGLRGVKLVTSDAHRGLKNAVQTVLVEASWQRCRVHFMRNALSLVPKAAQQMVTPSN
jgi:putative transposase